MEYDRQQCGMQLGCSVSAGHTHSPVGGSVSQNARNTGE